MSSSSVGVTPTLEPASPSTWLNKLNPFEYMRGGENNSAMSQQQQGMDEKTEHEDSSDEEDEGDLEGAAVDVEELLWDAQVSQNLPFFDISWRKLIVIHQNALISHNYAMALSAFKKASLSSSAACLSLGHLYHNGLHNPKVPGSHQHHHHSHGSYKKDRSNICITADYRAAAAWYIKGLEIEAETSAPPSTCPPKRETTVSEDSDEGIGGMNESDHGSSVSSGASSPSLATNESRKEMNLETLSDLSFALTSLYRIGKLTAASENSAHGKDKGQDLYVFPIKMHLFASLIGLAHRFCKGSRVAYRLTKHAAFKPLRKLPKLQEPHQAKRAGSLDSSDVLLRGIYVSLCYLLALTSYPSGQHGSAEPADHSEAVEWWEKAIAIQNLPGGIGTSRPAEDLVMKAKYRVDMIRIAKEREDEMNLLTKQRGYHRFHSVKSEHPRTSPRAPWEPLLSPTELLDTPLLPPKVSPVVNVLQHIKPSLPGLRMHSYQVTEKVHPSLKHPPLNRKISAPSAPTSPEVEPRTPPKLSIPRASFTLAALDSPISPSVSIVPTPKPRTRSIRSTTSFRSPQLSRLRSSSITTQLSVEPIAIHARASTTSLSSLWTNGRDLHDASRTSSYVSLSDLYKGGEMKQSWRAKTLALQASSALKRVWSSGSLSGKGEEGAVQALNEVLRKDAECFRWAIEEEAEEEEVHEEEQEQITPLVRVQAPTPTTTLQPSFIQQRSSLKNSFLGKTSLDPTLSALEANSVINAKSRCAFCSKKGLNFRQSCLSLLDGRRLTDTSIKQLRVRNAAKASVLAHAESLVRAMESSISARGCL